MLKAGRIVALDETKNLLKLTNEHCAQFRLDKETFRKYAEPRCA